MLPFLYAGDVTSLPTPVGSVVTEDNMAEKWISYLRVSTDKQGKSGLGIEAQRAAVTNFLNGGRKLVKEFVEVGPVISEVLRKGFDKIIPKLDMFRKEYLISSIGTIFEQNGISNGASHRDR
jgi:hypothetical protein